ncbi:hypothetical protein CRG98_010225 [Punica granatum]|uniref:Uncharacterized protein n=1 Tax=Punica granatum TaxID=22663 RepID=A0A2I0KLP8_PUNGR|nr:hypothetical protein CRG98_010225 [Punica granatum]
MEIRSMCGPEFALVGAYMRAPMRMAWECPPSRGCMMDTREKKSPLTILRPEGRGPITALVTVGRTCIRLIESKSVKL